MTFSSWMQWHTPPGLYILFDTRTGEETVAEDLPDGERQFLFDFDTYRRSERIGAEVSA